mmetsp:Transcript_44331/g.77840  ORF Transcript_44331/g.77840 Transcript_44331/m.77840 type:complete len:613 (-) Transcript_44331:85-1923(-)
MSARSPLGRSKPPATLGGWSTPASSQSQTSLRPRERPRSPNSMNSRPPVSTNSPVPVTSYQDGKEIRDVNVHIPNSVKVHACGQNLEVSFSDSMSLAGLQMALGTELKMPSQVFEICDTRGMSIRTDNEFLGAVTTGSTPLVASLPEASIHLIENRREELSQIQWKLVRDQLAGLGEKILSIGNGLEELTDKLGIHKKEGEAGTNRFRQEMTGLIDNVQDASRQNTVRLEERLEAVVQLVHLERNAREAAKQGMERQFQGLRDVVEQERSQRRSENSSMASIVEECRSAILDEARSRSTLEERLLRDNRSLADRIEAIARAQNDQSLDLCDRLQQVSEETNKDLQEYTRGALQDRASNEAMRNETTVKLQLVEERMTVLDARMRENVNRQGGQLEEMWAKFDSIQQLIEQARIEERAKTIGLRKKLKTMEENGEQQMPSEVLNRSPSAPGGLLRSQQRASSPSPMGSPEQRILAGPGSPALNLSGPLTAGNGLSLLVSQSPQPSPPLTCASTTQVTPATTPSAPGPLRPVPVTGPVNPALAAGAMRPGSMRAPPGPRPGSMVATVGAAAAAGAARTGSLQVMRLNQQATPQRPASDTGQSSNSETMRFHPMC